MPVGGTTSPPALTTVVGSSKSKSGPAGWSWRFAGTTTATYRRLIRLALFAVFALVLILILHSAHGGYDESTTVPGTTVEGEYLPAQHVPNAKRAARVHNVKELRAFCRKNAPKLKKTSWARDRLTHLSAKSVYGSVSYPVVSSPTCVDIDGKVWLDTADLGPDREEFNLDVDYEVYNLNDQTFRVRRTQSFALAIPAIGLLTHGQWISTHIWHLIHNCLEGLSFLFKSYNSEELFSVPTQTVLLRTPDQDWPDRYGNVERRTALSARVLNGFSSPRLGGPFKATSPVFIKRSRDAPTLRNPDNAKKVPVMYCFCQALSVRPQPMTSPVDPALYYSVQDLANTQFGEASYLTQRSLKETDAYRLRSHSWAKNFWRGRAFDPTGTYRPRALVIHREARLIGNYSRFIDHLRKLNFRVEEIFPERLPLEQQYHLGRYADLLVGMHGLGVAHAFWMDRFPLGCRSIVEFRPWATPFLPAQLQRILGSHASFKYEAIEPIDVVFGASVANATLARKRLLLKEYANTVWSFREFTDQTAAYDETSVFATLDGIKQHLDRCLPFQGIVHRFSPVLPSAEN